MTSNDKEKNADLEELIREINADPVLKLSDYTEEELLQSIEETKQIAKIARDILRILPDKEAWRQILENTASNIVNKIEPDKIPADLLENESVQTLADQIRKGDLEQAKETVFHMPAGLFMNMLNSLPSYVSNNVPPENAVILQEKFITELAERFQFPIDKVNRNFSRIWELIEDAPEKQLFFDVTPQRQGKNNPDAPQSYILLALEKRGTKAKPLTEYDLRVLIAAQALHEKNNGRPFTLQALYEQMGREGKLGDINRTKILESLESLNSYWIHIDNADEARNLSGRKAFKYHGSLLPFDYVDELENGQITKTHIRLLTDVPLMAFSYDRKQFTTISRQLLKTPVNHGDKILRIEDYFLAEIASIKNGRRSNKMLFSTIFKENGVSGRKQQARTKEKIKVILDHFQAENYFSSYKVLPDGIEIFYKKTEPTDTPKRRRRRRKKEPAD